MVTAIIILYILVGAIMFTLDDFNALLADIDAETTRIANRIEEILGQLERTDLTEAEEAELMAGLQAAADRLKGVGVVSDESEGVTPTDEPDA